MSACLMQSIYLVSVSLLSQRPLIRGGKKKEEKYETRNRGIIGNPPTISLVKNSWRALLVLSSACDAHANEASCARVRVGPSWVSCVYLIFLWKQMLLNRPASLCLCRTAWCKQNSVSKHRDLGIPAAAKRQMWNKPMKRKACLHMCKDEKKNGLYWIKWHLYLNLQSILQLWGNVWLHFTRITVAVRGGCKEK